MALMPPALGARLLHVGWPVWVVAAAMRAMSSSLFSMLLGCRKPRPSSLCRALDLPASPSSLPSPWRPENSSSAPLLFFPVVAILRRAASRSMPWPDLPPPWTPLVVPCA
uniref:Uncharacterized protein n=1 Tax=Zea mays TaxID=4577 RepID=A0A804N3G1_MAIZE